MKKRYIKMLEDKVDELQARIKNLEHENSELKMTPEQKALREATKKSMTDLEKRLYGINDLINEVDND